jgi:hypothetical protein
MSTKDGGLIAIGTLEREFAYNDLGSQVIGKNHAIVVKLDADGNEKWSRDFYEDVNDLGGAAMLTTLQAMDGTILVAGYKDADQHGPHAQEYGFLMKLDNGDGHTIWQMQSQDVYAYDAISQLSNGKLVLRGGGDMFFVDDETGTLLGTKEFATQQLYGIDQ